MVDVNVTMEIIFKIGILLVDLAVLTAFAIMLFVLPVVLYQRHKMLKPRKKGKNYIEKSLISIKYNFTEDVFPFNRKNPKTISNLRVISVLLLTLILTIGATIYAPELTTNR